MSLPAGTRLGPYEIVARLGAGAMGEVYRARDARLKRDVAIKVMLEVGATDRGRMQRFADEARAVAALSHANVLAVFDVGTEPVPFMVTELLEGDTLRSLLARGPLPIPQVRTITRQILAGLAAAHGRGIVHRDLKPENVFLTHDGVVKILDFGLSKMSESEKAVEDSATVAGSAGMILGTVGYMAPEQLRGLAADSRSDIFAIGAVIYEMVSGRRAFQGESPADTMSALLREPPPEIAGNIDAPQPLVRIIHRCLEKQPADRFQSVRDLLFALETLSDGADSSKPAARSEKSIAVLPFSNLSTDAENQYFSDGLSEDLINALARLSGLRVASRTSSFRLRGRDADIVQIGRELAVATVLEGSVRRAGARVRITAQLTNVADGYHIWSQRYDREMADVFAIQDEIVESIVAALAPTLLGEARAGVKRTTENLAAYELYLKGRHYWNQRSAPLIGTAIQAFEQAIARDASYALAYAGLADCYSILRVYGWTSRESVRQKAADAAGRALALDPSLSEAHFSKGLFLFHFDPHWHQAWPHFAEALRLNPRMALAHGYCALFLGMDYARDQVRAAAQRAQEIDPHSAVIYFLCSSAAMLVGDFDEVDRCALKALTLEPESPAALWPLTISLLAQDRIAEALTTGERLVSRARAPLYLTCFGIALGRAGRHDETLALVRELDEREARGEYVPPIARVGLNYALGEHPAMLRELRACANGGAAPLAIMGLFRSFLDPLRDDPEIDALLDHINDGARPHIAG